MVAVSLMPPIDHCASCEGRKAEQKAYQVAATRAETSDLQTSVEGSASAASQPLIHEGAGTSSVKTVSQPLLSPDLAVQASLASTGTGASTAIGAKTGTDPSSAGDNVAHRLQALKAYGA